MRGDMEWGSIPGLVRSAAERHADAEAVVEGRTRISYAELGARVERAAAACVASGLEVGDRVAIWAPNSLDWIVSALGAVSAGAVLVPLNTRFKGTEAADVLRRSGVRLLFVTGTFLGTSYVASLRRAAGDGDGAGPLRGLPALEQVVVLADDAPADFRTWKDFLAAGEGVGAAEVRRRAGEVDGSSLSDIVFTSGTTGRAKGATITHAQTLRAYEIWADLAGLRSSDRYLIVNPFFHTFGYKAGVIACLMRGATMIPQPVFNVDTALANIAAERVSVLPGPPTLHQSLLDHPARDAHDLSALRLVVTGAAVVPLRLVERLRGELNVDTVLTAYGLSEASGIVTMCRRGDDPTVIASTSGRAIPGTEVRVDAAPGQPGEVLVRGFNVMRGYYEDEAATAETMTADGWLRTGDVGILDDSGNLRITDRLKDMFIVGGFNAYPAEIEQLLGLHPDVADVAVIGVPDARLGEVGKAFVVR
ncbi:FadD3 family acyl-CoA ligase, partial [Streptomyces sp. NPDC058964]|uniref:FadD3 family acyl-CoA ligase n=1 Tax=Streptomyces sp. NPDC058964 TaxID=3346681 RepID=UPI0036C47B35